MIETTSKISTRKRKRNVVEKYAKKAGDFLNSNDLGEVYIDITSLFGSTNQK